MQQCGGIAKNHVVSRTKRYYTSKVRVMWISPRLVDNLLEVCWRLTILPSMLDEENRRWAESEQGTGELMGALREARRVDVASTDCILPGYRLTKNPEGEKSHALLTTRCFCDSDYCQHCSVPDTSRACSVPDSTAVRARLSMAPMLQQRETFKGFHDSCE